MPPHSGGGIASAAGVVELTAHFSRVLRRNAAVCRPSCVFRREITRYAAGMSLKQAVQQCLLSAQTAAYISSIVILDRSETWMLILASEIGSNPGFLTILLFLFSQKRNNPEISAALLLLYCKAYEIIICSNVGPRHTAS